MSGNHALVSVETADLDQLAKTVNIDTFRVLWGKKSRSAGVDVLLESATIAEGLIQGMCVGHTGRGKESLVNDQVTTNIRWQRTGTEYLEEGPSCAGEVFRWRFHDDQGHSNRRGRVGYQPE